MKLTVPDLKLLHLVLECGHRLEREWPFASEITTREKLAKFSGLIEKLNGAQSEDLRRLTSTLNHLTPSMTSRHLAGFLVAFERLNNKALRDDEFLLIEGDLETPQASPEPVIVIADNIRSAFNVGAIFRTAECFNLEEVVLAGYSSTPADEKTARTSMGTADHVAWRSVRDTAMAVTEAKLRGFTVVALETVSTAENLNTFDWPEKCAIMIGNERFGVDREALAQADHIVKIPLRGRKNSLNVGIALGIALHSRFQTLKEPRRTKTSLCTLEVGKSHRDHSTSELGSPNSTDAPPKFRKEMKLPNLSEEPWELTPIGIFRSESVHPYEAPRQATDDQSALEGVIELNSNFPVPASCYGHHDESGAEISDDGPFAKLLAPQLQGLEQGLRDLDGFDRIWLIYRFHHNRNWKPMVLPPRGPQTKRGVFATRAPYRPNAIGLSCVELVKIEGRKLFVRGFDLLDQTPIYDIKPYLAYADSHPEAKTGWLEGLEESANQVRLSPAAENQIEWLESRGLSQLRGFLQAQLKFDPLDSQRKRVTSLRLAGTHEIAYRTWRASFYFSTESKTVSVLSIYSGYSAEELADGSTNPLADGSTNPLADGSTNPLADGSTNPLADGSTNPLADGSTNPLADGSTNDSGSHSSTSHADDPYGDKDLHRAFLSQM